MRRTSLRPSPDALAPGNGSRFYLDDGFGSAHPAGTNAVFSDGSVKHVAFGIPGAVWQLLVRKDDGLVVDLTGF